jgi:hypothetical protein
MRAHKNIKIEMKTHVERGPSSGIGQKTRKGKSGAKTGNERSQSSWHLFQFRCHVEVFDLPSIGFSKEGRVLRRCSPCVRRISIFVTKRTFPESAKSSERILLGDLNVENKELRPELMDDTDFFYPSISRGLSVRALSFESARFPRVNQ